MRRSGLPFSSRGCAAALIATASILASSFAPRLALAQVVSEADRQAARELFQQGFQLQQAGKYTDALDKFQRAQAVYSAPTNLLHIAECQAQLGQLVESTETYRGLARLMLLKDTPQAFLAAQTQGAAELQQIEPRIPRVRVEVAPTNIGGLAVTIDDQPMNVALVGVDRPIDPGTHKVTVSAPGYIWQERTITVKEKDPPKPLGFTLQPNGEVTYAAAPPTTTVAQQQPPPGYTLQYPGMVTSVPYVPVATEKPWTPPPQTWTSTGFFFGARLGAALPTGSPINDSAKGGPGVGLEGYFRFAHKGFLGILGERDFYSSGTTANTSASSNLVAASIGFTTNAEGVGFMMDFFGGYRSFAFSSPKGVTPIGQIPDGTYGSGEGGLGMGVWIAAGKWLRIVPRFEASFGSFSASERVMLSTTPLITGTTNQSNGYAVLFFGVSADYNIDLKPKAH
jgi:hypothetical protein